jgi:hypothetical protein
LSWQQDIIAAEDRERNQRAALNAPFGALLGSLNSDTEEGKFSFFGATDRVLTIAHPFRSRNAWIRGMPEMGTTYLTQYRSDESNPHVTATVTRSSLAANDEYRRGVGVYRPLLPGEIDIASSGFGQAYLSRRSKFDMRAGSIMRWADQDTLISGDRSPTHNRQFMQYRSNELGEEERVGIVSRPKLLDSGSFSTWELSYPQVNGQFLAEQYISVKNPSNDSPAVLFRSHRGHVIDNEGNQILQSRTQLPLRYFEEYYAKDESSTRFEIDEKGNYYVELADAAIEGYELYVPSGNYKKTVGLDEDVLIEGNVSHTIGKSSTYQIGDNWNILVTNDYNLSSENGQMNFIMKSGDASQMVMNTRNHFFILDDTSGKEGIFLIHNSGSQINLDSTGSIKMIASDGSMSFFDATKGSITTTSSKGAYVTVADNILLSDSTGSQVASFNGKDTIQISAKSAVNLMAQQITIGAGSINLGNVAALSAVLAEPLALLFDTHIHASPVGPTSPPLPPNTAALYNANPATAFMSQFVKIRSNLAG